MNKARVAQLRNGRGWELVRRHQTNQQERRGASWVKVREGIRKKVGTGFLFALVGPQGKGKTQIAVDLMLSCSDELITSEYTSALGFFSSVKSTYHPHSPATEIDMMNGFCSPRLLVIDEFEKRSDNSWANQLIFELINRRYGMLRDTLILSNLGVDEFNNFLGASLTSRMNEAGGVIDCSGWESFR